MSRVEENSKLQYGNIRYTNSNGTEVAKVKFLEDISRSLAVIADALYKEEDDAREADLYVRDHLLIEWGMDNFVIGGNPEDTYERWRDFLENRRAQHE